MSIPWAMQVEYAMIREGPGQDSASARAFTVCALSAPSAICATYTFPYAVANSPRSLRPIALPAAANFATAPRGVAFDACPPVFE